MTRIELHGPWGAAILVAIAISVAAMVLLTRAASRRAPRDPRARISRLSAEGVFVCSTVPVVVPVLWPLWLLCPLLEVLSIITAIVVVREAARERDVRYSGWT